MARAAEIRPLREADDRTEFSCGQDDLDRFFRHYAGQNQFKFHLAVNYVAVADDSIVGFATVTVAAVERSNLPLPKLRKRLPAYPLPVLRLARLAVDSRAQGLGIGHALLAHVLSLALHQRSRFGCVGVVTDAKPDAVTFYHGYGFVPFGAVVEGLLQGEPVPMFLPIGSIERARSG